MAMIHFMQHGIDSYEYCGSSLHVQKGTKTQDPRVNRQVLKLQIDNAMVDIDAKADHLDHQMRRVRRGLEGGRQAFRVRRL